MLAGFHRGSGVVHVEELWGHKVAIDFHYFEPDEIESALGVSGLTVERLIEREPYPDIEVQTRRFYVVARKQG